MRFYYKLALTLCVLLIAAPIVSAVNVDLLQNGDFESWINNGVGGPPDNWMNASTSFTATQEAATIHGGTYSVNLTWTSQSNQNFKSEPFAVYGDSTYVCSLWVYDNDPAGRIRISYNTDIGNLYDGYSSDSPSWQLMVDTVIVQTGATVANLQIRLYDVSANWDGDATVYVDDVSLWGPEPSTANSPPLFLQVYSSPYPTVLPDDFVNVHAYIWDLGGVITDDSLYIQVDAGGYSPVYHDSIGANGKYYFPVGTNVAGALVEYYAAATDDSATRSESSVFSYTVSSPTPTTLSIAEVQFNNTTPGSGSDCYPSSYDATLVEITGVVTARYEDPTKRDRYFLQDADSVWSGVYVFNGYSGDTVQVGDNVTVIATVEEYYGLTEIGTIDSQTINSSGNALPAPIVITCADLGSAGCAPGPEAYEGVYIQINNATVTSAGSSGEFWINDGSGDSCLVYDEVYKNGDDPPTIAVSDFYQFVRGVGTYAWSDYKISPRFSADLQTLTVTPIAALQFNNTVPGSGDDCYPGDSVGTAQTINGTVTAVYQRSSGYNDFYVQDADSVWSGIYVYNSIDTAEIGDNVSITSDYVDESYGLSRLESMSSHITNSTGNALPAPIIVTCADLGSAGCAPGPEAYEGVLIQINNAVVTSAGYTGEFWINDGSGDSALIDDDIYKYGYDIPTITIGDTCAFVRGIGTYNYNDVKIGVRFSADYNTGGGPVCSGYSVYDVEWSVSPTGPDTADCWPSQYNQTYVTVCGVVTAVTQGSYPSFYMQDQANTAWGGIFVYDYTTDTDTLEAVLGDYVELNGFVKEYYGWTELDSLQSFTVLGSGQDLPDTLAITVADLIAGCDYSTEPLENELVRLDGVTVLSDQGYGELWITDASTADSIRIDSDLWYYGGDQPSPAPSPGATYDWIIGVVKWQGRNDSGRIRGFIVYPRFGSDYESLIIPEPEIVDVWSVDHTTLRARFDRGMDAATTENPANYSTTGGLSITAAVLDTSLRIVTLTTSTQPDNTVDSLVTVNVCDTMAICLTGTLNNLFHAGITEIATVQTPALDGDTSQIYQHIVTIKAVVSCDSSQAYYNTAFVQDASGPPYNGVQLYASGGNFGWECVVGDTVIMTGRVDEYYGATELTDLLDFDNVQFIGSGPQPDPAEVTAADLGDFATGEEYEGVLITVCDDIEVIDDANPLYGFTVNSVASPADTFIVFNRPSSGHTRYTYVPANNDIINGITGPLRWTYNYFRVHPRSDDDFNTTAIYCGGGGCSYTVGDVNGSDSYNGLDITYGVAFFKGGPDPHCPFGSCPDAPCDAFFYCGDVNGSCSYNGLDITYGVAFFKGGPGPVPCPSCPPAGGPASWNGSEIKTAVQPSMEMKSKSKKGAELNR